MTTEDEIVVPKHYVQFVNAIEPHINLLRASLATPPALGESLHELTDLGILIDASIIERLADSLNSFGSRVFASQDVYDVTVIAEADSFGRVIRSCLANFDMLRSRPFPEGFESGHPLLVAIIEKPLRQLLEAMETVQEAVFHPKENIAKHGSFSIKLHIDFSVTDEVAAWEDWCNTMKAQVACEDSYFCSQSSSKKSKSRSWLWALLGAYAGYELFFDKD